MTNSGKTETAPITRLAPSPTGRIHAGNILSFLICWLFVKQQNGTVVLRIEDLDASRSRPEYAQQIMRDLEMLGISWDRGPYYQSQRMPLYREAIHYLKEHAKTYPCFCSRASVLAASAPHSNNWRVYPNTCRNLEPQEQAHKLEELHKQGRSAALRIQVPNTSVSFNDAFQGLQQFNLEHDCGDFVVRRASQAPSYNLAVVVDDANMGITTIVRGADLCPVTPQQIYLQSVLGLETPLYAHHAVLLAANGRRIAKRNNDASLETMLETFKSPKQLIGHLASMAGIIESPESCSPEELLPYARLDGLKGMPYITWPDTAI